MTHPSDGELGLLTFVADEIREVVSERGYRVDVAMEVDPAFGSGWSRSYVRRDLIVDTATVAASQVGVDFRSVNGSGREFRFLSGTVDRRYRLRRGERGPEGELRVPASSDSALATHEPSLLELESWVFVWTLSADEQIDETVVAEIVGWDEGSPGYLIFGEIITLGGTGTGPPTGTGSSPGGSPSAGGFTPTNEPLPGLDDEGEETGESARS